jgi:EEF1A lysine methyltransferase 4
MTGKPPPFAALSYWEDRFKNNQDPYDWLQPATILDTAITEALSATEQVSPRILHIGCGTSQLSFHLRGHVQDPRQIQNTDFSSEAVEWGRRKEKEMFGFEVDHDDDAEAQGLADNFEPRPGGSKSAFESQLEMPMTLWTQTSLLDLQSVVATCSLGAYQVVVDKSLCDAVACSSDAKIDLPYFLYMDTAEGKGKASNSTDCINLEKASVHPLHLLGTHLALLTPPGARWIALSYSEQRFPFLQGSHYAPKISMGEYDFTIPKEVLAKGFPDPSKLWRLLSKEPIPPMYSASKPDEDGVHRPPSRHWVYIMERTNVELKVRGT